MARSRHMSSRRTSRSMSRSSYSSSRSSSSVSDTSESSLDDDAINAAISIEVEDETKRAKKIDFQPMGDKFNLRELHDEALKVISMALHEQLEEAITMSEARKERSLMHAFFAAQLKFILATNLEDETLKDALESYKFATSYADAIRKKSWANAIGLTHFSLFRPNYEKYTDEECISEMLYGFMMGPLGALHFWLGGKNSRALLKASWFANRCYRSYWECENILKYRKQWTDEFAHKNFEATVRFVRGAMAIGMDFAPKLVVKFMRLFGYAPTDSGIHDIAWAADYKEGIAYPIAVACVFGYDGIVIPSLYHFPPNFDGFEDVLDKFDDKVYGSVKTMIRGAKESLEGNIREGIKLQLEALPMLRKLGKAYLITHAINVANFAALSEWDNAIGCLSITKKERKLTKLYSSGISYLYAGLMQMKREDLEFEGKFDEELEYKIAKNLKAASHFKGIFLLKRIKELFIVPMAMERAKKYHENIKAWPSPIYEVLYLTNLITVAQKNPSLLEYHLERIDKKLTVVSNDNPVDYYEQHGYLTFYRGTILRNLKRMDEALRCFLEVVSIDSKIQFYREIIPQAFYEIGIVFIDVDPIESEKWLNKAINCKSYFTKPLIDVKVQYAFKYIDNQLQPEKY